MEATSNIQFLIDIDDISLLKDIKKAFSMVKGVRKIRIPELKRLTEYEQSVKEAREGKVNRYATTEEFFNKMGI